MSKNIAAAIAAAFAVSSGNAIAQRPFGYKAGGADAPISGGAAGGQAQGGAPSLEKCEKPYGTVAISEPQDFVMQRLAQQKLPSPVPLLRLIIQQSNCFQVVERGV